MRGVVSLDLFDWSVPTQIYFGWGERARLPQVAARLGMRRPCVITGEHLVHDQLFQACMGELENAGLAPAVWPGVRPDPSDCMVDEGAAHYRRAGCDGVIGYGGGSSMDTAKGVSLLAHTGEESIFPYLPPQSRPLPGRVPLIAIPTTAGTGSEVACGAALTDTRRGLKSGIFSPVFNPDVALVDPELTVSCPPRLTASVGLDAFANALEGYTSRISSPITDAVHFAALELAVKYLPRAVFHGHDRHGRVKMCQASLTTALGFPGRLWTCHDISTMLATLHHTQHGFSVLVTLPALLEFNLPSIRDRLVKVAPVFGLDTRGGSPREVALAVVRAVAQFARGVGAPTLAELTGCGAEMIATWAREAAARPTRPGAPRPLTEKDARWVFERSLHGY